jgi:UDP-glucose 4-epimerase
MTRISKISLITGAAGFIGSHLTDRLLAQGQSVIGIDNFTLGRRENLTAAMAHKNFTFIEADLNETGPCLALLRKKTKASPITTVWHLAANSDIQAGGRDPGVDLRLTFLTTYNVLRMMETLGAKQLVFASSSAIYGDHKAVLTEETGPVFPVSNYGAMKLASEGAITAALENFLERAWICRFPNVVGGRATHGVIFDFLNKLRRNPARLDVLGNGTQQKPYLHVRELVEAMLFIHQRSRERLNYYNIAPAHGATTVKYIAEAVVRAASPKAKIHYGGGPRGWTGDVPKFRYSTKKLKTLGWSSKLNSNQAINLAIMENNY